MPYTLGTQGRFTAGYGAFGCFVIALLLMSRPAFIPMLNCTNPTYDDSLQSAVRTACILPRNVLVVAEKIFARIVPHFLRQDG